MRDLILPQDVLEGHLSVMQEMNMAPDVKLPARVAARQPPAEDQNNWATITVSIPDELPAWLRHVHYLGSPGTGKGVLPEQLLCLASGQEP